jgi:hypothetical protein
VAWVLWWVVVLAVVLVQVVLAGAAMALAGGLGRASRWLTPAAHKPEVRVLSIIHA